MPKFETPSRVALEARRVRDGLTQRQIAEAAGGTQPQVCDWLSGESRPNAAARMRLAAAYPEVHFLGWFLPSELPAVSSEASDSAHPCEVPQAAHAPPGPAFSADAAPVSQVSP